MASLGHNEKSWVFDYYPTSGYHVIYMGEKKVVSVSSPGFTRLGVYLDWPAGTLSFYMVSADVVNSDTSTPIKPNSMRPFIQPFLLGSKRTKTVRLNYFNMYLYTKCKLFSSAGS